MKKLFLNKYTKGDYMIHRQHLEEAQRIVIKVGSSSITHGKTGHISLVKLEHFVRQVSDLKNAGKEVIVVTSGAQAVGLSELNLKVKPKVLAEKQAVAAVGQASLMMIYQKLFSEYNHHVGQILITKEVTSESIRNINARNTFQTLLKMGVIPIVNENDTISTEEIEFGDNDRLSATVAIVCEADLLIILSDIDGLFDKDPKVFKDAKVVEMVEEVNEAIYNMSGSSISSVGTGGMTTKLIAASMVNEAGIDMIIANSSTKFVLQKIKEGQIIGTIFKAKH